MTEVLAPPAALAALYTGGPLLILAGEVAGGGGGGGALALPGLSPWRARRVVEGRFLLHRDEAGGEAGAVPLAHRPPAVLALVGPLAEALAAWWTEAGEAAPPVIPVAEPAAALPALARHLAAALAESETRRAELHRALALTRADYEETREVVGALARTLGQRPPEAPRLALATAPDPEGRRVAGGEAARLRQPLGLVAEGIAAVALHVAGAEAATARLRVRLVAAESGRILGAWAVAAPEPGWLALDLPAPIGPVRETAVLDIAAEGAVTLSLDAGTTGPEAALTGAPEATGGDRALALKVWTAPAGGRFLLPRHWLWEEAGLALPAAGVPLAIPEADWARARVLAGAFRRVGGAGRPSAVLGGSGETAALLLPPVHAGAADLVRVTLVVPFGDPAAAEAALWLLPGDAADPAGAAGLVPEPGRTAFSGWRGIAPETRGAEIALPIPLGAGSAVRIAVQIRRRGGSGDLPCVVEVTGAALMATGPG